LASILLLPAALILLYKSWYPIYGYVRNFEYDPRRLRISKLSGVEIRNPTSLQWGPDNRLYVATREGLIVRLLVERDPAGDYRV